MKKEKLGFLLILLGSSIVGVVLGELELLLALSIFTGYCIVMLGIVLIALGEEK